MCLRCMCAFEHHIMVSLLNHLGTVHDLPKRKRPRILSDAMRDFIDEQLKENDELTSRNLKELLQERWPEVKVSLTTIKRERRQLGWVCTKPHYCQLLREASNLIVWSSG